jgi:uncharacterized protein (TIGR02996 family)
MTDEAALLAAIAARPDDDTPRLVYADWLDDHGDADRAEFIRLQCELAQGGPDDPAAAERADELENRHRTRSWFAGVPTALGMRWEFRRGFPERLEADAKTFLNRFNQLAVVPWLRDLCLTRVGFAEARRFVRRDWPPGLIELEIEPDIDAEERSDYDALHGLIWCPQLARLRALRLFGNESLPAATVDALVRSPYSVGLKLLAVPGDPEVRVYAPLQARFGDRLVGEGA